MDAQHSPLPWKYAQESSHEPPAIIDANNLPIAEIYGDQRAQRDQNAKLIVASVNNVERLTSALILTEARSHINTDGSYTVDATAMDAVCEALLEWSKAK